VPICGTYHRARRRVPYAAGRGYATAARIMTAQVWVALFGGATAGAILAALSSQLIGWQSRRHDRQRWLLDKQLEAYADFNKAAWAWFLAYHRAGRITEELNDQVAALSDAQHRVRLLAPDRTSIKTEDVALLVLEMVRHSEPEGTSSVDERKEEWSAIAEGLGALAALQRADIGR
jgi:hypothetical protein